MLNLEVYFKFLPYVLDAVKAVEASIPLPGAGKTKLDLVTGIVAQAYATEQDVQGDFGKGFSADKLVGIVTKIATFVVGVLNAVGVFKKSA